MIENDALHPMPSPGTLRDQRGVVFVEFLIAFLPVYTFFLCLIQLALLFVVRLVTEHTAMNAARAAAVVIGDDPKRYGGERINRLTVRGSVRYDAVRDAALLSMAPLILNGFVHDVKIVFPSEERPGGPARTGALTFAPMNDSRVSKVRVRVEVEAECRIGIANRIVCPLSFGFTHATDALRMAVPMHPVRAEAVYPYQGARYDYP
ncbi:MAG TPA: hypothetical protein VJV79_03955 [Polyangiaceae bacterium]|nr:hypothetical protein [Polyangiaceae bacterium]